MNLKKTYPHVHFGALLITAVYLCIVISHLFFAPKFVAVRDPGHNSAFKKNTELFYYLVRNDRSMFNESKPVKMFPKNIPVFFVSILTGAKSLPAILTGNTHLSQFLPDHHYSYLSNRIMRI